MGAAGRGARLKGVGGRTGSPQWHNSLQLRLDGRGEKGQQWCRGAQQHRVLRFHRTYREASTATRFSAVNSIPTSTV